MPSRIYLAGPDDYIDVEQTFSDGGLPPVFGLVGGVKVKLQEGAHPYPRIYQVGTGARVAYLYQDGRTLVSDPAHIEGHPGMTPEAQAEAIAWLLRQNERPSARGKVKAPPVAARRGRPPAQHAAPAGHGWVTKRVVIDGPGTLEAIAGPGTDTELRV